MRKILAHWLLISCICTFGVPLLSQQDSIKEYQLGETVITAQASPTNDKNAIYKVHVINQRQIQSSGAVNLRDLILQELGLNISQRSVFGASIEMQGISKENIKILVDGVPVIGRLNGIIDLHQIPLTNVRKVEMIRGPVSVFYGSDALGGVIHLITQKEFENKWNGQVSAYRETTNANQVNGRLAFQAGRHQVAVFGGVYAFDGFSTGTASRVEDWEERNQWNAGFNYTYRWAAMNLTYQGSIFNEKLFSLGDTLVSRSGVKNLTDVEYSTSRFNHQISFNGMLKPGYFVDLTTAYQKYERFHDNFNINLTSGSSTPSKTDTRDENVETFDLMHLRGVFSQTKEHLSINWSIGLELQRENNEGIRITDSSKTIFTAAGFASLTARIGKHIQLQPAFRISNNDVYGTTVVPALNGRWTMGNSHVFRLGLSRGFRAPGIKELFLNFKVAAGPVTYTILGNPDLKTEVSNHFSVHHIWSMNSDDRLESDIFYNHIDDLIVLSELVNNSRNYINIEQYRSLGINARFIHEVGQQWSIQTGVGLIGRYNKLSADYDLQTFDYAPELTTAVRYTLPGIQIRCMLNYKYNGKVPGYLLENQQVVKVNKEDFHQMEFNIAKNLFSEKLELQLGIKNIFDVRNIETFRDTGEAHSSNLQLWGRSYYLMFNIKF